MTATLNLTASTLTTPCVRTIRALREYRCGAARGWVYELGLGLASPTRTGASLARDWQALVRSLSAVELTELEPISVEFEECEVEVEVEVDPGWYLAAHCRSQFFDRPRWGGGQPGRHILMQRNHFSRPSVAVLGPDGVLTDVPPSEEERLSGKGNGAISWYDLPPGLYYVDSAYNWGAEWVAIPEDPYERGIVCGSEASAWCWAEDRGFLTQPDEAALWGEVRSACAAGRHGQATARVEGRLISGRHKDLADRLLAYCAQDAARYRAERAASDAAAGLPALQGSPKQIAWATDLRRKAVAQVEELSAHPDLPPRYAARLADLRVALRTEATARYWIDNRFSR